MAKIAPDEWHRRMQQAAQSAIGGTWPIAKQWPDVAMAQMDGRWFQLAHIGNGLYAVADGPFGIYQQALLQGDEA